MKLRYSMGALRIACVAVLYGAQPRECERLLRP
jgi:hypothetical protein